MDFITDLPLVKGHDSILVVVNQGFTKGIILIPCSKTITAEETAQLLLENLYKHFGLPDKIISDRGPQFTSRTFVKLLKLLGIKSSLSSTYHPQTDGTTEWVNQEIKAYLAIYCASHPEEWLTTLHTLEFTHNNRWHVDRQKTPFKLMFGDSPQAIPHSFKNTRFPAVEAKMKQLQKNREEALTVHELARVRMIKQRRSKFTPFQKGNKVWLDSRNLQTLYHKKMAPKWEGPFEIINILGPLTYWLKLLETWRIHNVFHTSLLRQYKENDVYGTNYDRPPAKLDNEGQEVYNVETILKHRRQGQGYQYYVKLEGYRISDHRSLMGTRGILFERRWHSRSVQTMPPTMNSLTPETASTLSLTDNMEELDWYFQDIFNQFGNMYCLFNDINRLLNDCPLEFLLFKVQQLISFLRWHWYASHPRLWTMILRPLPYCLFFRNLCPSRTRKSPNLPCSIPFTKTTHLFGSFSTLLNHLLHHLFLRTNSLRITW